MCRLVPGWFCSPGPVLECVILFVELLLIIGAPTLLVLLWRKLELHLLDAPKHDCAARAGKQLNEQGACSSAVCRDVGNYNYLIYVFLCGMALTLVSHRIKDADKQFRRAVECEHYISADICYYLMQADPDAEKSLYLTINDSSADDAKKRRVEYLLGKGANPNHISFPDLPGKSTPISCAVQKDNRYLLPLLLSHCNKITSLDAVLTQPVREGDVEAVRLLLDHGASADVPDTVCGRTALHWAANPLHEDEAKALEVARLLLQHGAIVNAVQLMPYPPFVHTALDIAEKYDEFPAMDELLREYGGKRASELVK